MAGNRDAEILEAIATLMPGSDPAELVRRARAQLVEDSNISGEIVRGWTFHAMRACYQKMYDLGDYPGALRAAKELHHVFGAKT